MHPETLLGADPQRRWSKSLGPRPTMTRKEQDMARRRSSSDDPNRPNPGRAEVEEVHAGEPPGDVHVAGLGLAERLDALAAREAPARRAAFPSTVAKANKPVRAGSGSERWPADRTTVRKNVRTLADARAWRAQVVRLSTHRDREGHRLGMPSSSSRERGGQRRELTGAGWPRCGGLLSTTSRCPADRRRRSQGPGPRMRRRFRPSRRERRVSRHRRRP